jgi:hypothetical protein
MVVITLKTFVDVNRVVINLKQRRVKKALKKALEQSILAFNQMTSNTLP